MADSFPACSVISLPDVELEAQISCARGRLVAIAPGFTEPVAKAIAQKWRELGPNRVQVVLDPDPEVCRLGWADASALGVLFEAASGLGTRVHQQQGLRVGIIITDETTTVYSPAPRLIEAGGLPGERLNALRLDAPVTSENGPAATTEQLELSPKPVLPAEVKRVSEDLATNPPMKFDLARKVRVFNARFEFVEFELHGLFLSRKRVQIPSDLLGLAKDPKAQKLLRSSFQLIEDDSGVSGERVAKLKHFIVRKYLINLPGYGTVVLRSNKAAFQTAVRSLERYIHRFQRQLKKKLQKAIDANREVLTSALVSGVLQNPPQRWVKYLGEHPKRQQVEAMLRSELTDAFGKSDELCGEMKVKAIFKGVTYESLNDPEFMRVAGSKIPTLNDLHEEFDAAKAAQPSAIYPEGRAQFFFYA